MIHLALEVLAFLFLAWVGLWVLMIVLAGLSSVGGAMRAKRVDSVKPARTTDELCARCGTFHGHTGNRCTALEQKQPLDPAQEALHRRKAQELGRDIRKSLEEMEERARAAAEQEAERKKRDDEKREQEAREFLVLESERVLREREERQAAEKREREAEESDSSWIN